MNAETEILVEAINGFFHIYLPRQRCFSKNTVDSYKTAFKLFLDHMLEQHDFPLRQMTLIDLNKDNLSGFVDWLSVVRKNSPDYKKYLYDYLFYITCHGEHHSMSRDTVQLFMKNYGKAVREICSDIPERVHPHQLRHARAIHLYRGGMPLSILSEFFGHTSEETTRIYAYADTEMKRKAIEKATPRNIPGNETPGWDISDDEMLRKLTGLY